MNVYLYTNNSPLMYVDRDGMKAKSILGEISAGAIQGDFIQDPNAWNTTGQILGGLVPVYGQASDVRDTGAAWKNCSGWWNCAGELSFAGAGFVPIAWDGIKLGIKGLKNPILNNIKRIESNRIEFKPPIRWDAPLCADCKPIEIHHVWQNPSGPFVEMTRSEHRLGENFKLNHSDVGPSTIDRGEFKRWKQEYWKQEWDSWRFNKYK